MIAPDPRAEERVGSVLHDKWTLERLLGVGGMGAVYAARHRNGARAAVKVLSPSMGRIPHVRKRFLHEGYAANRVEHAGAVKVLDDDVIQDGTDEGTAYLVMELLEGESLSDRAKREPSLGERELLELADGVLAVLESAHENGVVHRDLKPDNLFLARDAERGTTQIKVLDFGLARLLEAQELTIAGMAVGTPTYMSPEQAAGQVDKIDGRTDIYALGSILFQLATNKRIHDAAHTLGLVVRMATTPAPKVRTVLPEVTEPFARVVDHALAFVREDRYPTASAMRADVQLALRELGGAGKPTTKAAPTSPALLDTVQVPAAAAAAAAPSLGEVPPAPREKRGSTERRRDPPRRTSRAWFVLLLMLGGGAFWFVRSRAAANTSAVVTAPPPSAVVAASASAPATSASASASAAPEVVPADAAAEAIADAAAVDDASVLPVASAPDELDASVDGGEEDDEDEDDDELDASAPAALPASAASGHRPGTRPVAKPTKKKKPPRRPGQPKRRRRWRY